MVEDNTQRNLDDLVNAAKMKLSQEQQETTTQGEDIYADMRNEMQEENYTQYSGPDISYHDANAEGSSYDIPHEGPVEYGEFIDPNDTPIFENGPRQSQLDIWKKNYSNESVFHVRILDRDFVFRTLNRFEYKQIVAVQNTDALLREEMICRQCVLFPTNYDYKEMAVQDSGYPSTLAQIIMENSGFTKEYAIEIL